ncbi:MAG TPA: DNA polymerase III subunit alpha [Geobacteraceae bacterium]|nr:DNA polymerase III subunit alpha [Geobacteraceae bacterium]
MDQANFAHLHVHSQYSLLDGAIKIGDLVRKAEEYRMPAVALTDHGNMFGAIEFYLACNKAGIKPVIGCETYIAPDSRHSKDARGIGDASYHLVLLCENMTGYRNLCRLVSVGYKEGFYYRPRIDKDVLREYSEGLIALSACLKGEVAWLCEKGKIDDAIIAAREFADIFPDRYYIELQENTLPEQDKANRGLIQVASELKLPMVATNDCHYLNRDDARAHEILLCIQTGKTMGDPTHMCFSAEEFHLKSPEEMAKAFHYAPEALSNTVLVADRCNLEFDFKTYHFPQYTPPDGKSLEDELVRQAREGLESRLAAVREKRPDFTEEDEKGYRDRLEIELDCIIKMGFPGYFLIVADFINWAKNQNIPVGPGRGSAAGSLVAYAIRITDLDPIPYNLLFERFLNPERISMPDIDVDFCQDRREEVIQYVTEKYGRDKVCQIITFGTMMAKGVIRDVGRALDFPYSEVDKIAKLVPNVLNIQLSDALKQEPKLNEMAQSDPRIRELLDTALKLEGLTRHASTHAAGVVVAPAELEEFCPVYKDQKSNSITTQFAMKFVEKIGLVKFDFLGLKNLTVINNAVKLIRAGKNPDFDITSLGDDDEATYLLLQSANTTGVFQLESSGMKDLLHKLKPSCFEDIIAVCALYRPGPLGSGMVDDFIDRKHGRKPVTYELPQLQPILKDTYGVIVYQEQVMQIARTLGGYSLGGADLLRRAMGKKDAVEMARQKEHFLAGAKEQNVDPKKAEAIFDLMAKFAEYGFNKSHSAAYALLAYQTAYLKAHYPVEFMAALLTEDMENTDKVIKNITDCREMGIEVLPPDLNASERSFKVLENSIRFGLGAVKNVGTSAVEAILESRDTGPFKDIFDFCERVDLRRVNKRVAESLIKCGAFDSTGAKRAQMIAALEFAMEMGQKIQKEKESAQVSLFGADEIIKGNGNGKSTLPEIPEWGEKELLAFEKEAIGFYITGHPLDRHEADARRLGTADTSNLAEKQDKSEVRICGIVSSLSEKITKKGDRMAFALLEDRLGSVEIMVFPDVFAVASEYLKSDDPLLVTGTVDIGEESCKIKATEIIPLRIANEQKTQRVNFTLFARSLQVSQLESLKEIISRYHGACKAFLHIVIPEGIRTTIVMPDAYSVQASEDLSLEVERLLGYNATTFE